MPQDLQLVVSVIARDSDDTFFSVKLGSRVVGAVYRLAEEVGPEHGGRWVWESEVPTKGLGYSLAPEEEGGPASYSARLEAVFALLKAQAQETTHG